MNINDNAIIMWLREREENARRIGASKADQDRAGWIEDATYFHLAAEAIRYYRDAYSRKIAEVDELLRKAARA